MDKDLKWIKKHYGEEMSHMCRSLFPRILETEGLLPTILQKHFKNSRQLVKDIVNQNKVDDFKNFIYSHIDVEKENAVIDIDKSASELLDMAGYVLYPECETEEDIQSFRKYYAKDEELCTFWTQRLDSCRVWFAVKKDVDKIKREDFENPDRQDEYGTSVISIQFTKSESPILSIKNRYNHTVNNPDNTFNSDLNNIIQGLTDAFERDYGVRDSLERSEFELKGYVKAGGVYYKYNQEINGIYYCADNVVIQRYKAQQLPGHVMLIDYFIFDFKNNTITLFDERLKDSFIDGLSNIKKLSYKNGAIDIEKDDGTHIEVGINENREITFLNDQNLEQCGDNFLTYNKAIEKLVLPNLQTCGDYFLSYNMILSEIEMQKLQSCGDCFLKYNKGLTKLNLPCLNSCGDDFIDVNEKIEEIILPSLRTCGDYFLSYNKGLIKIDLPTMISCGDMFISQNNNIESVNMPELELTGNSFLMKNRKLSYIDLPNLEETHGGFLGGNRNLEGYNLPKMTDPKFFEYLEKRKVKRESETSLS